MCRKQKQPNQPFTGSREQCYLITEKLAAWGYYDGRIDGIYGSDTYRAVLDFQRKNRWVDGIVGKPGALGYQWAGGGRNVVGLLLPVVVPEVMMWKCCQAGSC